MSRPPVTDTHATRRVDCGHGNQGPKQGRGCSGRGRPRWAMGPRQGSLGSLLGRSPSLGLPTRTPSEVSLRTEPAGSPVLLKDQCVEPLASGPAQEAFLCCVPVRSLPRPPGLERNCWSRPVLMPEVRQHTRQGGDLRSTSLPAHVASPTCLWAVASARHPVTTASALGRAARLSPAFASRNPSLSEQQLALGPGSLPWGDIPTFSASQVIFLGRVLRSPSVGCLLVTRPSVLPPPMASPSVPLPQGHPLQHSWC